MDPRFWSSSNKEFLAIARRELTGRILEQELLSHWTTYRIGGPVDYLIVPSDLEDLRRLTALLAEHPLPAFVLGGGANLLASDAGFRGVAIHLGELNQVILQEPVIEAGAGIPLDQLVLLACRCGMAGLEKLSGIPGTLGGALRMNAGAFNSEISDHLVEVKVLRPDGEILTLSKGEIGFSYRSASQIKHRIILGGRFSLKRASSEELFFEREKILARRDEKQPWQFPSAGSVFKRPPGRFAGQLIEECGLKGKRQGKAGVSGKHSGFIVNYGGAAACEVLFLIHLIRRTVLEKFKIHLDLEQELIGFESSEIGK